MAKSSVTYLYGCKETGIGVMNTELYEQIAVLYNK
jgi:hypothetical protein